MNDELKEGEVMDTTEWIKELCPEIAEWQVEFIAEHVEKRVEAGFGVLLPSVDYRGEIYDGDGTITDEMERFAALVAAAEQQEVQALREQVEFYKQELEDLLWVVQQLKEAANGQR